MSFPVYSEYKRSGVEWLGDVPDHWNISPLKFSASCNDTVLPDSTDNDYEIEYVEISDVNEMSGITGSTSYKFADAPSRARRMLQDGDVLVSTVRTYLRAIAPVVTPPENLIASTGFAVVRPRKGILDGAFLGYLLRAEWWISEVIARSVGVSYPAINASQLIGLNVPVPAWHEQTQIASFLDHETARIDALIKEQQRLIELLKEKRQAVISHAVTKGLDHTVPMKNSNVKWLGEVPAHWEVKPLRYVSTMIDGDRSSAYPSEGDLVGEGIPFVSSKNIVGYKLTDKNLNFITPEKFNSLSRGKLCDGDLVITVRGTIGHVAVFDSAVIGNKTGFINAQMMIIRPDVGLTEYIRLCSESYFWQKQLDVAAYGSTVKQLSNPIVGGLVIALPPRAEIPFLVSEVRALEFEFETLISQSLIGTSLLQERRSSLISAAVTGKIDVRDRQPPANASTPELAQETV